MLIGSKQPHSHKVSVLFAAVPTHGANILPCRLPLVGVQLFVRVGEAPQ
jgi:hypothetical protein